MGLMEELMDTETQSIAAPSGLAAQQLGRHGLINRDELLRLIQQALTGLGYAQVAQELAQESGVACESNQVSCAFVGSHACAKP
jgi:hypothetical protein